MSDDFKKYLGCKIVEAHPQERNDVEGYCVRYKDGYESWSPKEVFESAYLMMDGDGSTVTTKMVTDFIATAQGYKVSDTTVLTCITLVNGYEMYETSSCVDPDNFDMDIGVNNCLKKIHDKIWPLLGFLLKSAHEGFDVEPLILKAERDKNS